MRQARAVEADTDFPRLEGPVEFLLLRELGLCIVFRGRRIGVSLISAAPRRQDGVCPRVPDK